MASVNKVIIVGNLGRDPELKYTQGGSPVCRLSIATTRTYNNKNQERVDETEWHRVVVWSKQAEHCNNYLAKGRQVYIEGRLRTSSYEDKEGIKRYSTEIVADTVQFLGSRADGGGGGGGKDGGGGGGGFQGGGGGGQGGGGQGGGSQDSQSGGSQGGGSQGGGSQGGDAPAAGQSGGAGQPAQGGQPGGGAWDDNYVPSGPGDDDIPF